MEKAPQARKAGLRLRRLGVLAPRMEPEVLLHVLLLAAEVRDEGVALLLPALPLEEERPCQHRLLGGGEAALDHPAPVGEGAHDGGGVADQDVGVGHLFSPVDVLRFYVVP